MANVKITSSDGQVHELDVVSIELSPCTQDINIKDVVELSDSIEITFGISRELVDSITVQDTREAQQMEITDE